MDIKVTIAIWFSVFCFVGALIAGELQKESLEGQLQFCQELRTREAENISRFMAGELDRVKAERDSLQAILNQGK